MRPYQLTLSAEGDLREIIRYTLETWGEQQALHYAGMLEKRFYEIASKTAIVWNFSNRYPEVMVNRCEHHYIFYIASPSQKPSIFAILHERMDLLQRLKDRLG